MSYYVCFFLLLSFDVGYSPYHVSQVILALVPSERYPNSVDLSYHETADPALLPVNNSFQNHFTTVDIHKRTCYEIITSDLMYEKFSSFQSLKLNLCAVRSWWDNSAATIVAYPHPFSGHSRRVCILIMWVARSDLDLHLEPHCSQTTLLFFAAHFFFSFSFDKDAGIEIKLVIYILVKLN